VSFSTQRDREEAKRFLEFEEATAARELLTVTSKVVLHLVGAQHNWDSGFAIPLAILRSAACDFGTALMLYWLAEPEREDTAIGERKAFLAEARYKLDSMQFATRSISFSPTDFFQWNRVYRHRLEQRGFAAHLLDPAPGEVLDP
jgi:hypothetical protein